MLPENSVSFLTTNKGKPMLLLNQFMSKCNKTTPTKKYWVCSEKGCGVSVHTTLNDELLLTTGDHEHVARPDILETKTLREKMKNRILNETTSITKIYDDEISNASLSDEGTALFPTVAEYREYLSEEKRTVATGGFPSILGSNMSKARRKKTPVIPTSCVFDIPTFYQETLSQKQFLLMDFFLKRGKDRVIVYATAQQLQLLFDSEVIFVDGTFGTAPGGFEQVFLIHIQLFGQGN